MLSTDIDPRKSGDASESLLPVLRGMLLDVAEASIKSGLRSGRPIAVDARAFPAALRRPGATFVTLHIGEQLRGCIGTVEAVRPLVNDVAHNAFHAAFSDPRFPPLRPSEFPQLDIEISILSPLRPIDFLNEGDLLDQIQPGVDGLELEYGPFRGLLLPDVWNQLPDKKEFVAHLKLKAGLPPTFWSNEIRVHRFTTERFTRKVATTIGDQ